MAAIFFTVLSAVFYAPLLLGISTFPHGDFTYHFLSFSLFQRAELAAGRLPVWNPYTYAGHPFLADIQAAVFYPLSNILLAVTLPWDDPAARLYFLQLEVILHTALAGFFTYLLVVELTGVRWAGLLAGVAFAFSGYLTSYPPLQLAILRTAVWLPLILLFLRRAAIGPHHLRWWIAAAVALVVAFLGGHPQTFLYIGYTAAAWMIFTQVTAGSRRSSVVGVVAGLWLFLFVIFGLAAAQLLPTLEFTQLSVRANADYAFVSGGFPLQDTWQIVLPGVFTQFSPLYVGAVPLGLATAAVCFWVFVSFPLSRSLLFFFVALTLIALLLSYGGNSFLYPIFHRIAPGWDLFRGQERAAFLVALGLSVLAGLGAAATPEVAQRMRRRSALIYGALATAAVYSFGLLWQLQGRTAVNHAIYLFIAIITLLFAMAAALFIWLPGWSRRRSAWLTGLAFANLALVNMPTNLENYDPAAKMMVAPELAALSVAVTDHSNDHLGLAGRVFNEFRVYEDYGMTMDIEDDWGSSPLRLATYVRLFDNFPLDRLWRLTGVEHVLTWRRELFEPSTLLAEFPQATDTTYLHRLSEPNPRAWLVRNMRMVDDEEAVRLLADHDFDIEQTVLLAADARDDESGTTASQGAADEPTSEPTSIALQRIAPNRLAVDVTAPQGGVLVLSENWMPGWRVEAAQSQQATDGQGQEIEGRQELTVQRVNLTLLGVPLPPGRHSFHVVYAPESVRLGLWISSLTLAVLAFGLLAWWIIGRARNDRASS
jgi:hypothetical protein